MSVNTMTKPADNNVRPMTVLSRCTCVAVLFVALPAGLVPSSTAVAQQPHPPYPDVREMSRGLSEKEFRDGSIVCGWEALRHRMRSNIYRTNIGRLDAPQLTQFERLVAGSPDDVAGVNREIVEFCRKRQAEVEAAWRDPKREHPAKEVCNYQVELIPLAVIALRIGERITPETHQAIKDVLAAFRPEEAGVEPGLWLHAPGYNGGNPHDTLSMVALTWELTRNPDAREAAYWGLRGELENLSRSGDMQEFNLLEGHWCSTNGYDVMKAYLSDPELARMARLMGERIWLNRFLMWSPVVERITGPGSRMAPGAWLGTSGDRLQFATGIEKPIWVNEYFDWDGWPKHVRGGRWQLDDVEGMVPDLPAYLQDVAWRKQYPNELRCSVQLVPWMSRYPVLPGFSDDRPPPVLAEMDNYQTRQYALGSITQAWDSSHCMVYASAWWNDAKARTGAPLGSPERFTMLYPRYVFNGAAFLDRSELAFENRPDTIEVDEWTGRPGPWLRNFTEYGRAGVLQHKNTIVYAYSGRNCRQDGIRPVPGQTHRVSAAMCMFRWRSGVDGLYVNREPVASLPMELRPGDWWFIQDGDTYAGVRPLEASHLRGACKTTLEARTRQIVLYQDNYVGDSIEGIAAEEWVKARSGFVVELGDAAEYGSFERFRDIMLEARVKESADGFVRHVEYDRSGRQLEMKWHSYEEKYPLRRVDGKDRPVVRYLRSPEFFVGSGELRTHDASLATKADETLWLLSAAPSQTYVAYQPQPGAQLPLRLETPIARIESERFPFGKLVAHKTADGLLEIRIDASFRPFMSGVHWRLEVSQALGMHPSDILIRTDAPKVMANINGDEMPVAAELREGKTVWVLDPYARIPRVRDRVSAARANKRP